MSGMQRLLNDGWQFVKRPFGSTLGEVLDLPEAAWRRVDLPHDWLIGQASDLYETSDGWYRRALAVPPEQADRAWLLNFDGVYMDCEVWLNGAVVAEHRYGYTAFEADLTGKVRPGENALMVRARFQSPNSRWYSGAGIFRDVTLRVLPRRHLESDGLIVDDAPLPDGRWRLSVRWTLAGAGEAAPAALTLTDAEGREVARAAWTPEAAEGLCALSADWILESPRPWSCLSPYLYALTADWGDQREARRVGLRSLAFDPDRGLLLNGESVKLHGVCLHHDLGALGAAFNAAAFRRQLRLMKAMGANALRTAHNPPASAALDVCDEEGVLVIDEFADMWERSKTPYDYARFFPECWRGDVASWIRRDRHHACVAMWSVGNEIYDTHASPRGAEVLRNLRDEVRAHDPAGHAGITFGSNYMPWENTQKAADDLKLVGYNYAERLYAEHHAEHPDWVIYGSETASVLSSRGVYHLPLSARVISEEDEQCSALGNGLTSWGTQDLRRCLVDDLNTPYSLGQFLWSGIDYIGEPTPYHTRSCYFGMADTAGFPKDLYYQVKAAWNPEPMAHIGVAWDWNPGQVIDVPVYTNAASCELLLNGLSLGVQSVDGRVAERSVALWRVPYAEGTLTAVARDADGREIACDERRSHGDAALLRLTAERTSLRADGEDVAFVAVEALDGANREVSDAADRIWVRVEGPARLLGLDNGDSTDSDGYRVESRCLFNGKLLIMVGATDAPGRAWVRVRAEGLEGASLALDFLPAEGREGHGRAFEADLEPVRPLARIPARRIALTAPDGLTLTPEHPSARFEAALLPAGADAQRIEYRVVNALGIVSPCAEVTPTPEGARVTGRGDGEVYLRAVCRNGATQARVISQLPLTLEGFGATFLDPYGFVTGGLCDIRVGEITSGNEKGIAFDRTGDSMAGFTHVDFGPVGSDEITLPVFELGGEPVDIALWMGDPRNGGHMVDVLHYHKKSIWNVYQSQTWKLPERFVGVQTVAFGLSGKIHLKGFSFTRQSRAWLPLRAGDADAVYGDQFERRGGAVLGIGNNVTLLFRDMDFGEARRVRLTIAGRTPLDVNAVQVRISRGQGEVLAQECRFAGSEATVERAFGLDVPGGACEVAFVFLPGSRFDFEGFRFERVDEQDK